GGERHADGIFGEDATVWGDRLCARFETTAGERDIGRHNDCGRRGARRDPVVGGVGSGRHDHAFDQRIARDRDTTVGYDMDSHAISFGDAIDLRFYRAGVGVDEDLDGVRHDANYRGAIRATYREL